MGDGMSDGDELTAKVADVERIAAALAEARIALTELEQGLDPARRKVRELEEKLAVLLK